jgi:pimeloyl-ACP methyl ester carboxylesterase
MSTHRLTTHDGLGLHVRVDGPDSAPLTVVLVHCWTADHDLWRYQVRDLRSRFGDEIRILSYDHRGHGQSDPAPYGDATIANLGLDLSLVLDTFVPEGPVVFAGHSIGGMTLMELVSTQPEFFLQRVSGVAFIATSGGRLRSVTLGLPEMSERIKDQLPRMLTRRARMVSRRSRAKAPVIETRVVRRLFGADSRLRDQMQIVESLINTPADSVGGFFDDILKHERHDALVALEGIPVRILVGDRDQLTPVSHARRIGEATPGARLFILPGAGHFLPLERDENVTAHLAEMVQTALDAQATRAVEPAWSEPR